MRTHTVLLYVSYVRWWYIKCQSSIYVSAYFDICVRILLHVCSHSTICVLILLCPHSTRCPHTTTYVSSYYYKCVLILLGVLILLYRCPHTTICVLILLYMCPQVMIHQVSVEYPKLVATDMMIRANVLFFPRLFFLISSLLLVRITSHMRADLALLPPPPYDWSAFFETSCFAKA